ncbi:MULTISPECIES: SDR family NAD(P)-dependent oxidoreductase [unclassified Sulfurospirillum]|uniref:SDR family NAD(P)-dependent oxidoreductase n=1 Tax=unclassified Sulfurospirillum TaxID=2618290 RepID=UPI0005049886|nr:MULTISPECIES: SDR family NAD(P)-dependent oxidoreductase [unclassified Sulfurospirillum]KFL34215.1 oxidoreductase [Sulfurospirillum sp. SCADC]
MSKIIIITGSRKGIGYALCEAYLSEGHTVIGCSREATTLAHPHYRHFILDVADEMAVVAMIRSVKKEFGRIDVLLNNAGIASMNHTLTTSLSTLNAILQTNIVGTFLFLREVSKAMMKQKKGRIVNYSTIATALRLEGEAIYAASKAAIENLTETTAKELSPFGITVNAIAPTPIETDLIKAVPKEKMASLLAQQAIARFGTFDDIKHVIDFLIDDKSDFITAQVIHLGGVHR